MNKKRKRYMVHRLVAQYFIPNPNNLRFINHIDLDRSNNKTVNLEWISASNNTLHAYKNGKCQKGRPVLQYSLDGKFLNEYKSLKKAASQTNGSADSIQINCAKRTKSSGGFIWKYKKEKKSLEKGLGKCIPGYDQYFALKDGRIYSKKSNRFLKIRYDKKGYGRLDLTNNKTKTFYVHRLIAKTFLPNPCDFPVVNHKDNNSQNNNVDNLEWCTVSHNTSHAVKIGAFKLCPVRLTNTKDDIIIEFESCAEAARTLECGRGEITAVAKRYRWRKTVCGFTVTYVHH